MAEQFGLHTAQGDVSRESCHPLQVHVEWLDTNVFASLPGNSRLLEEM